MTKDDIVLIMNCTGLKFCLSYSWINSHSSGMHSFYMNLKIRYLHSAIKNLVNYNYGWHPNLQEGYKVDKKQTILLAVFAILRQCGQAALVKRSKSERSTTDDVALNPKEIFRVVICWN